jgi:hypothetical protein
MKGFGLALGALVLHQLHASSAYACAPAPFLASQLLPLEGATDVGVDAALIASANFGELIEFELLEAAFTDAGPDAGGESVELAVDCGQMTNGRGYLCIAKPVEPLLSHTRYAWRTTSGGRPNLEWQTFETSDAVTPALDLPTVDARIVEEHHGDNPCGVEYAVTLNVSVGAFEGLAVFGAPGALPWSRSW